jgi:hypothetical protein
LPVAPVTTIILTSFGFRPVSTLNFC